MSGNERPAPPGRQRWSGPLLLALALAGGTALVALVAGLGRFGEEAEAPGGAALDPAVKRISERVYQIGEVVVDREARTVTCQGWVNQQDGLVEYLAVGPGGKLHESVLEIEAQALHLQLGLILLGLSPAGGLERQGDPALPQGPAVRITVSWETEAGTVSVPAERTVWDRPKNRTMGDDPWVFSGWPSEEEILIWGGERSLIATYRDPAAILNNRLPEGADDTVYDANPNVVPAVGTPVRLTIHAPLEVGGSG